MLTWNGIKFIPILKLYAFLIPIIFALSLFRFVLCSKPALTEGLEIDQYIWAILNTLGSTPIEEVIIDSDANWKSVHGIGAANIKVGLDQFQRNYMCHWSTARDKNLIKSLVSLFFICSAIFIDRGRQWDKAIVSQCGIAWFNTNTNMG